MLPDRDDPGLRRQGDGGAAAGLIRAVIGKDAVPPVKLLLRSGEIRACRPEPGKHIRIRPRIDRVVQDIAHGVARERVAVFCGNTALLQSLYNGCQRAEACEQAVHGLDGLRLLRKKPQAAGTLCAPVDGDGLHGLRGKAGRRDAAEPAAGLGQLTEVVADALGNGLALELREDGCNVHHGPAHGRGRVELLPNGNERHVQLRQPLDEGGEVSDAAADPVEPVDDEHTEAPGLGRAHHPPEGGAVQVPAGEAVIFKNFRLRRVRLVRAEILAA